MPPVSSIWIPVRRQAPALRVIQRVGPRLEAVAGYAAAEPAAAQSAGAPQDATDRNVRVPVPTSR